MAIRDRPARVVPGRGAPILASVLLRPYAVRGHIRRSHGRLWPITRRSVVVELSRPSIRSGSLSSTAATFTSFEREAPVMAAMVQRACILGACMILSATALGAQQDSSRAEMRRRGCEAARAGLQTGRIAEATEAMLPLRICGADAAPVLASAWLLRWDDAYALNGLMGQPARQTDPALFDALATVARDERLPTVQRCAAVYAMAGYADPSISGLVRDREKGGLASVSFADGMGRVHRMMRCT